jgi:hypothetical protein
MRNSLTDNCCPQNHWICGHCPSSGVINIRKYNVSETGSVSVFRWGEEDTNSVGSLRNSWPQSLDPRLVSLRDQLSRYFPPLTWIKNYIQFPKRWVSGYLEYRTMNEVHEVIVSECWTPSSYPLEPVVLLPTFINTARIKTSYFCIRRRMPSMLLYCAGTVLCNCFVWFV